MNSWCDSTTPSEVIAEIPHAITAEIPRKNPSVIRIDKISCCDCAVNAAGIHSRISCGIPGSLAGIPQVIPASNLLGILGGLLRAITEEILTEIVSEICMYLQEFLAKSE